MFLAHTQVVNLPGVRAFGMGGVSGNQPLEFTLYELESGIKRAKELGPDPDREPKYHRQDDMRVYCNVEISNFGITKGGRVDEWVKEHGSVMEQEEDMVVSESESEDEDDDEGTPGEGENGENV